MESSSIEIFCHACRRPLELDPRVKIFRREECPQCHANIHCCKMCKFYDPLAYNECCEPMASRVLDKEKANFCEYFSLPFKTTKNEEKKRDDLFSDAKALFKD